MNDIKEKLINAVADGILDSNEVVEKLLEYIDNDTVQDIIEDNDWDIGQNGYSDEYED
jgi:hypothetical protein